MVGFTSLQKCSMVVRMSEQQASVHLACHDGMTAYISFGPSVSFAPRLQLEQVLLLAVQAGFKVSQTVATVCTLRSNCITCPVLPLPATTGGGSALA